MKSIIIIALASLAVHVIAWFFKRRSRGRISEIAPTHVLQKRYGLYAENRPEIRLDPAKVPEDLRALIPYAEKWGVGDDIIRSDMIDKADASEKRALHEALLIPDEKIDAWRRSFDGRPLSDEAAAFMYMQLALDEMRARARAIHLLDKKSEQGEPNEPEHE